MTALTAARQRIERLVWAQIQEAMRPAAERPQWEYSADYLRRLLDEVERAAVHQSNAGPF